MRTLMTAVVAAMVLANTCLAQTTIAWELESHVRSLRDSRSISVEGVILTRSSGIAGMYEENAFQPLWTNARTIAELDVAIRSIEADGLSPASYHQAEIAALAGTRPSSLGSPGSTSSERMLSSA